MSCLETMMLVSPPVAFDTIVSTEELARHPQWRIFDCRHDLARPELGEQQYREAHIPGAVFAHLDRDLAARREGRSGRHPLPYPGAFIAWLGQQGVRSDDQIVCYDGGNGMYAARLWWMMRWVGHDAAAVLDGGFAKWRAEGRAVTSELPRYAHSRYPVRLNAERAVGIGFVEQHLHDTLLVDARAPERFRGEKEPIDPVAGHIPGARNRFNFDNMKPDGTFKSAAALREEFLEVLGKHAPQEVVSYCGSGVAACHNLLAMEIAGLGGGKLYAGSWSDWISDPKRAIAR
jgi:thiosulfate/3-mercaptopyruvate sulfurtransferase